MNLYKYMGHRPYSFTNSNGENISGISLYIACEDENVIGYCTDKINLKPEIKLPSDIKFGDNLTIMFDRKGKAVSVISIDKHSLIVKVYFCGFLDLLDV